MLEEDTLFFLQLGLLPASLSFFDIKSFVEGGKKFLKKLKMKSILIHFFPFFISYDTFTKKRNKYICYNALH